MCLCVCETERERRQREREEGRGREREGEREEWVNVALQPVYLFSVLSTDIFEHHAMEGFSVLTSLSRSMSCR